MTFTHNPIFHILLFCSDLFLLSYLRCFKSLVVIEVYWLACFMLNFSNGSLRIFYFFKLDYGGNIILIRVILLYALQQNISLVLFSIRNDIETFKGDIFLFDQVKRLVFLLLIKNKQIFRMLHFLFSYQPLTSRTCSFTIVREIF